MTQDSKPVPDPPRRVLIVGGGTAGWMAAVMLSRTVGLATKVALIESEEIGTVGVGEATIPPVRKFNRFCGIDEAEFLRATQGTFKVGIQFEGWGRKGDRYLHAFGRVARELDAVVKMHFWWLLGRGAAGPNYPRWEELFLGRAAMDQRRFGFDRRNHLAQGPLMPHAYQFDAIAYAGFLRGMAETHGVERVEGRIGRVDRDGATGHVSSVTTQDGRTLDADLFIDCSGFRSLLLGGALEEPFDDWSHWLAADRAVVVQSQSDADGIDPGTRAIAHDVGWQWHIPLQQRTGNGHVYSSAFSTDEAAHDRLMGSLSTAPVGDPRILQFRTGRRRRAWVGNVIALGLSSGFLEPLESTSIHLVQSALERLVELFPSRIVEPELRDDFNRRTQLEWEQVRDFIIAHYKVTQRDDSEFWRQCANMDVPDTLRTILDLWAERGALAIDGGHLFQFGSWAALLIGQNLLPQALHPMASRADAAAIAPRIVELAEKLRQQAAQMPPHGDFARSF